MEFENSVGPWLSRTMKMVDYYFQDVFNASNIDLTKNQWILLKILIQDDGMPQNELAFITNRDKSVLTRLISVMEKKNLVKRKSSKQDKRINHVFITKKGKLIFEETLPVINDALKVIQNGLTSKEISDTIEIMKRIQSNLNYTTKLFTNN